MGGGDEGGGDGGAFFLLLVGLPPRLLFLLLGLFYVIFVGASFIASVRGAALPHDTRVSLNVFSNPQRCSSI